MRSIARALLRDERVLSLRADDLLAGVEPDGPMLVLVDGLVETQAEDLSPTARLVGTGPASRRRSRHAEGAQLGGRRETPGRLPGRATLDRESRREAGRCARIHGERRGPLSRPRRGASEKGGFLRVARARLAGRRRGRGLGEPLRARLRRDPPGWVDREWPVTSAGGAAPHSVHGRATSSTPLTERSTTMAANGVDCFRTCASRAERERPVAALAGSPR